MKKLLFITWDGPQTSYMEGLFMPIFQAWAKQEALEVHVLQYTWADAAKTAEIRKQAEKLGIFYTAMPVIRKLNLSLGTLLTIYRSKKEILSYIEKHHITWVMPRSTFPAMMLNRISKRNFKIIFDADGLPIEERVDFGSLKKDSLMYRILKKAELQMLRSADRIICRSQKAINHHLSQIGENYRSKFFIVSNGRDKNQFTYNAHLRTECRKALGLQDEILWVYAGSLGPQYCLPEMLKIFEYEQAKKPSRFLILTGNTEFAQHHIPPHLQELIIIKKVPVTEVPAYLNAADRAFALRQPTFSMQGVAPIKLGEYLLCGLPVVASKGIGDTEEILKNFPEAFLYDHQLSLENQLQPINQHFEKWQSLTPTQKEDLRQRAIAYFSLEAAAASYKKAMDI